MPQQTVLIPLPDRDFDVTEVAVPWRLLTRAARRGHLPRSAIARALETAILHEERPRQPPDHLPAYMERLAYYVTFWKLGRYYRTYPATFEEEVRAALDDPDSQFVRGLFNLGKRGTATDDAPAFALTDRQYVSARWPGDAYLFTRQLLAKLDAS